MQQRFVIAMACIGAPDLIVLDEPTSPLDPVIAAAAMIVPHDLGYAVAHADQITVLKTGRIERNCRSSRLCK